MRMPLGIKKCAVCGKEIEIFHKVRLDKENVCCSVECMGKFMKSNDLNCECPICHKKFHVKPYHKNKCKVNYCSRECFRLAKKEYMKGEGNHQYGLKGSLNASWKSDKRVSNLGYYKVRCLEHPYRDSDDYVLEHRLVAEQYLLNKGNSIEINGKLYLKPELVVHHIDGNKLNNSPDNLEIMTLSEHSKLHNNKRKK